ncbi:glycosyltransferase family 4 protein [Arthrobacter sp. 8AJ]|uniref:glycosyltransferase family 4 protein n=1 Tax=Arthrobacter sp. 8AJ TaxID=2653130 RepID=UPI0012EF20BE|nr:glycosyltransferase family 4 protein [Arthrobacter sp. 8AJ]VXC55308.1 conserved hypothetical protein [Arthrobacter sp. 8AJ]
MSTPSFLDLSLQIHEPSAGETVNNKRVVILQEYVPQYRLPFFLRLIELGKQNGIDIRVAAGRANQKQSQRRDGVSADFITPVAQYELQVANTRMVFRRIRSVITAADLIIMEQARRNLDAYFLLLWPFQKRKIALWGHGRDYVENASWVKRRFLSRLTRAAAWFFAYTSGSRDSVVAQGYPFDRITVVQNSIDTVDLQNDIENITAAEVAVFRTEHNLTKSTAIFVGGLDDSKRLPFLFAACRQAYRLNDEFRLLVAGTGPLGEWVQRCAQNEPWLRYAGPLFGKDKALALASADIICMPGRVGLVAVDSFAAGRPIVTTSWAYHGPEFEYLSHGATCFVSADDELPYAEALIHLLTDKPKLRRMQDACRAERGRFTIEAMASRFFEGIQRAIQS